MGNVGKGLHYNYECNPRNYEQELKTIHTRLIYHHIGWMTALRFQLREPRAWENLTKKYNAEYRKHYSIPEHETKLEAELAKFLSEGDLKYILSKKNRATHIVNCNRKIYGCFLKKV